MRPLFDCVVASPECAHILAKTFPFLLCCSMPGMPLSHAARTEDESAPGRCDTFLVLLPPALGFEDRGGKRRMVAFLTSLRCVLPALSALDPDLSHSFPAPAESTPGAEWSAAPRRAQPGQAAARRAASCQLPRG